MPLLLFLTSHSLAFTFRYTQHKAKTNSNRYNTYRYGSTVLLLAMCLVIFFVVREKLHRLVATTVVPFAAAQQETPTLPRKKLPAKPDRLKTFDRSIFAIILCCTLGFAVHCRAIADAITIPPYTFWEAETDFVVDLALGFLVHVVATTLVFDPTIRKQGPYSNSVAHNNRCRHASAFYTYTHKPNMHPHTDSGHGSGTTYDTKSSAGTMYDTMSSFRIIQSPMVIAFRPEAAASNAHIRNAFSSQLTIEALGPSLVTSLAPPSASPPEPPSAPLSAPLPPQLPPKPTQAKVIVIRSATTTTATTKRKTIYRKSPSSRRPTQLPPLPLRPTTERSDDATED
jgi:hypothetical protein